MQWLRAANGVSAEYEYDGVHKRRVPGISLVIM